MTLEHMDLVSADCILQEVVQKIPSIKKNKIMPFGIFDIDGTILDPFPRQLAVYEEILAPKFNLPPIHEIDVRSKPYFIGDLVPELKNDSTKYKAAVEVFLEHFLSTEYLHLDQPYPGASDFVQELRKSGLGIIYLTSRHLNGKNSMADMTIQTMGDLGFPIGPSNEVLFGFKSNQIDDDIEFKRKFAQKFTDPYMRKVFPTIQYDWTETPLFVHLNMIGNCASQNYGVPEGGSLEFSKAIEQRYRKLRGAIHYNSKVEKILVENNQAVGVKLADGTEHRADTVVSDAFTHSAIFNLLEGRYVDDGVKKQFAKPKEDVEMGIHVSLGVKRDLSKEPRALVLFLEKPLKVADKERTKLDLELFGYDPSMAPQGKSVIKVLLSTSYTYWKELYKTPDKYHAEKAQAAETVLNALEKRFPGLKDQVEVTDVATPLTTERFTGIGMSYDVNWGLDGTLNFLRGKTKTLPGLRNFFLCGGQAGLPGCAAQARNTIIKICQQKKFKFASKTD